MCLLELRKEIEIIFSLVQLTSFCSTAAKKFRVSPIVSLLIGQFFLKMSIHTYQRWQFRIRT
jgi:hypothetical protein